MPESAERNLQKPVAALFFVQKGCCGSGIGQEVRMRKLHVATDGDIQFYFDEADVREACRIMRCGEHVDECISLMKLRAMECALCSSVLNALKKSCARKQTHPLSEAV